MWAHPFRLLSFSGHITVHSLAALPMHFPVLFHHLFGLLLLFLPSSSGHHPELWVILPSESHSEVADRMRKHLWSWVWISTSSDSIFHITTLLLLLLSWRWSHVIHAALYLPSAEIVIMDHHASSYAVLGLDARQTLCQLLHPPPDLI